MCVCVCVCVCVCACACVCVCGVCACVRAHVAYIRMYMQTQQCTNIGWYLVVGENDFFFNLSNVDRSYWIQPEGLMGV